MTASLVLLLLIALFVALGRPLWALTANANVSRYADQELRNFPVAAAVHIYRGAAVGLNPAGYLKPFVPGDEFAGIAYEECDNSSGAAAAESCSVYVTGDFNLTISSVAVSDIGKQVFATADNGFALSGHPDGFVGRVIGRDSLDTAVVRLRAWGEKPKNGFGCVDMTLTGMETLAVTGATAGTSYIGAFEAKSILGLGFLANDAEGGGLYGEFDATAEVALASLRQTNDPLPVDEGITFEARLCVTDKGDNAALDIDFGLGTALTANSEANVDHADMVQLACFHMDGNSDDIYAQSDDNTTDVAAVDTTINNDSTTDLPKNFKIIVRPTGSVEFWVDSGSGYARVLSSTTFAVLSTALLSAFVNMEKTSDDTTAKFIVSRLRVAGAKVA